MNLRTCTLEFRVIQPLENPISKQIDRNTLNENKRLGSTLLALVSRAVAAPSFWLGTAVGALFGVLVLVVFLVGLADGSTKTSAHSVDHMNVRQPNLEHGIFLRAAK